MTVCFEVAEDLVKQFSERFGFKNHFSSPPQCVISASNPFDGVGVF